MIKKILIFLALLLVAAVALFITFGSAALNKGIKSGVETIGPQMTQTEVTLDEVDISLLSGSGTLKGLNIGNPAGFKSEHIFALGQIDIDIDTKSLTSDTIVIALIDIQQPQISYEKKLTTTNIKKLQKNIDAFTGASKRDKPADDTTDDGTGKQLLIKKLIIEDAKVNVGLMGAGMEVPLPRIEMENIGEDGKQQSVGEVLDLVLREVITAIGPAIAGAGDLLKNGSQAILDTTQSSALKDAGEAVGDTVNKATEGLKSLFGN